MAPEDNMHYMLIFEKNIHSDHELERSVSQGEIFNFNTITGVINLQTC